MNKAIFGRRSRPSAPAFQPLEAWLRKRGVEPEELQGAVDQFLEQVRQTVLAGAPQDAASPPDND